MKAIRNLIIKFKIYLLKEKVRENSNNFIENRVSFNVANLKNEHLQSEIKKLEIKLNNE